MQLCIYILYICVCVCAPTKHTHMIRTKHKGEREWEEKRDDGEGRERNDFHFSASEEGKWVVETETRKASTHDVGNKKQERKGTEWRIYIYII